MHTYSIYYNNDVLMAVCKYVKQVAYVTLYDKCNVSYGTQLKTPTYYIF